VYKGDKNDVNGMVKFLEENNVHVVSVAVCFVCAHGLGFFRVLGIVFFFEGGQAREGKRGRASEGGQAREGKRGRARVQPIPRPETRHPRPETPNPKS
jgi:hypothetical protein